MATTTQADMTIFLAVLNFIFFSSFQLPIYPLFCLILFCHLDLQLLQLFHFLFYPAFYILNHYICFQSKSPYLYYTSAYSFFYQFWLNQWICPIFYKIRSYQNLFNFTVEFTLKSLNICKIQHSIGFFTIKVIW